MTTVLFSTTTFTGSRRARLKDLLESLRNQEAPGCVRTYLLLQNSGEGECKIISDWVPEGCTIETSAGQMSLSAARNQLLQRAQSEGLPMAEDIVAFPDDDCWYPKHFLSRLGQVFRARPELDVLICGSSPHPADIDFTESPLVRASASDVVRRSSSNAMFFRGCLLPRIGAFDTRVGVGTPHPGGEDVDFLVRAFLIARETTFLDLPLVGHPEWDRTNTLAKYFPGSLIVLARHAYRSPPLMYEFLRKSLVGAFLVAQMRMRWQAYREACSEAFTELRHSRQTKSEEDLHGRPN